MNLQQNQRNSDADNALSVKGPDTTSLIELATKGVATAVVIYRHAHSDYTRRLASHLLKHVLTGVTLASKARDRTLDGGTSFALYVAAGLRLIARETSEKNIMEIATAAGAPIDRALELKCTGVHERLARLGDIWAEELANTPVCEYVHQLPLDRGNFLTYLAGAELAMRDGTPVAVS